MMSHEELEKALEKAKKELQERLDQMTPEERAQAEENARKLIEADEASRQKLLAEAKAAAAGAYPGEKKPKFCTNCGAPAGEGKYCTNCGSLLRYGTA